MSFTAEIHNSNSFHPVSRTSFHLGHLATEISSRNCSIHVFYRLPSSLFVDAYELAQQHESYTFFKWGDVDLEKPVHAVPNSETDVLVSIHPSPAHGDEKMQFSVEVPLHARYGVPKPSTSISKGTGNYHDIVIDSPQSFMACPSSSDSTTMEQDQKLSMPPPYLSETQLLQVNLSPESMRFVSIPLSSSAGPHLIRIPVGHGGDLSVVQYGTAVIILLSFGWVLFTAIQTAVRLSAGRNAMHRKVD